MIRDIALRIAAEHYDKPYVYGAKGPDSFDCSGFLMNILQRTGQVGLGTEGMWNAQKIFDYFSHKGSPIAKSGAMVFYGKDELDVAPDVQSLQSITHCAMLITPELIIGANGLGPKGVGRLDRVCVQPINYHKYKIQGVLDIYGE